MECFECGQTIYVAPIYDAEQRRWLPLAGCATWCTERCREVSAEKYWTNQWAAV